MDSSSFQDTGMRICNFTWMIFVGIIASSTIRALAIIQWQILCTTFAMTSIPSASSNTPSGSLSRSSHAVSSVRGRDFGWVCSCPESQRRAGGHKLVCVCARALSLFFVFFCGGVSYWEMRIRMGLGLTDLSVDTQTSIAKSSEDWLWTLNLECASVSPFTFVPISELEIWSSVCVKLGGEFFVAMLPRIAIFRV